LAEPHDVIQLYQGLEALAKHALVLVTIAGSTVVRTFLNSER